MSFSRYFTQGTRHERPRLWQASLGSDLKLKSRLIRIPTGLGKTQGVLSAWAYHRLKLERDDWPRRLVWCLPMRTLTEQTVIEAREFLKAAGHADVLVHMLMGGADPGDWAQHPSNNAVLGSCPK